MRGKHIMNKRFGQVPRKWNIRTDKNLFTDPGRMKQHHKQKRERITRNISTWDKRMSGKVQNYFQSYRLQCSCHSQESCASLATKRQYLPVPCSTFLSAVWMQCNTLCLIQLPSKGCGGEELPLQRTDICYPTFLPNMYTRPENSQVHPSHLWIDEDVPSPMPAIDLADTTSRWPSAGHLEEARGEKTFPGFWNLIDTSILKYKDLCRERET